MKDFMTRITTNEHLITAYNKAKTFVQWLLFAGIFIGIFYGVHQVQQEQIRVNAINDENWKNANCPGLLSITRSARDTLIVMKAEPLCNQFVLETLE